MSDKLTDHDIESLYKAGANEKPSHALNEIIINLAKQNQAVPIIKRPRLYQTWYGQLSTAASFVLVAVLYFENSESLYKHANHVNEESLSEAIQDDTSTFESAPVSEPALMSKSAAKKMKSKAVDVMEVEAIYMEKPESSTINMNDIVSRSKEISEEDEEESKVLESSENLYIASAFKQIKVLLNAGQVDQANVVLNELIMIYPRLESEFTQRYKALTLEKQVP